MGSVVIETSAGAIPGHLSLPDGGGPRPAVVVVHELFGLNDDIRAIADRFAAEGYLAFAPDLTAFGNRVSCLIGMMRDLRAGSGDSTRRIQACRDWLAGRADCTGNVGIAGFCLGGGFALLLANSGFGAAAAQYGHLPRDLPAAFRGACPVVASYGGKDRTLRGKAAQLAAALAAADVAHDVKEYAEAGHSFMNRAEPPRALAPIAQGVMHVGYVDSAAQDAWERILAMFATALR